MLPHQRTWAACGKVRANTGYRSGLEKAFADDLVRQGVPFEYEPARIAYTTPSHYIPDFTLRRQALVIETKGAFTSLDRSKMLRVKEAYPDLDIRFLFSNPNTRLGKLSKTTYGMWCTKHGFPFAKGPSIPQEWVDHVPSVRQKEAFTRILNINGKKTD